MKVRKSVSVILIVILLILTGWYFFPQEVNEKDENNHLEPPDFTLTNYPRVDGSIDTNSLETLIACKLLNVSYYWHREKNGNREITWIVPNASIPDKEHISYKILSKTYHYGTHYSYMNLIENKTDLILVNRLPSENELMLANDLGVQLDAKAIAIDAFVILLNKNNTVNNLTIKQIQNIYTGKIINWSEVGGNNSDIITFRHSQPNRGWNDIDELMGTLIMKDMKMIDSYNIFYTFSTGTCNVVGFKINGIGYSTYYSEKYMKSCPYIKLCEIKDVVPNYENIKTRKYPLTIDIYIVTRNDLNKNSTAYLLRDWLLTEEGQNVVKESGYIPV